MWERERWGKAEKVSHTGLEEAFLRRHNFAWGLGWTGGTHVEEGRLDAPVPTLSLPPPALSFEDQG